MLCVWGLAFVAWMKSRCHLMGTVKALAICWDVPLASQWDFICYFCLNLYLRTYLHMLAMNALVWLCKCACLSEHSLIANMIRTCFMHWLSCRMLNLRFYPYCSVLASPQENIPTWLIFVCLGTSLNKHCCFLNKVFSIFSLFVLILNVPLNNF